MKVPEPTCATCGLTERFRRNHSRGSVSFDHDFKPTEAPAPAAPSVREQAVAARKKEAKRHKNVMSYELEAYEAGVYDTLIAAARAPSPAGGLSDHRLVELYGEWSEEHYAAGFYSSTPSSIERFVWWLSQRAAPAALKDYELMMLDMLPDEVRAAPGPVGGE